MTAANDRRPCTWPDCLTDEQAQQLCDDILADSLGQPTPVRPDPQINCGCTRDDPAAR